MDMMILFSAVTMIATAVIAYYAHQSFLLSKKIQDTEGKFKRELNDLYKAIVISNILSGQASYMGFEDLIKAFKSKYKGTSIFEDENKK